MATAPPPAPATTATKDLQKRHRRMVWILFIVLGIGALAWASGSLYAEVLFVLAVAPALFIVWHFHHADKYKEEPISLLVWTFVLGGVLAFVTMFVEPEIPKGAGIATQFLFFLFGVGLIEEFAKFLAVRAFAYRSKHFDEAMDGVIFGICAAMGFAAVENIFYVFQYGGAIGIFRAFVSVPGHAFYGAIMGYYLGEAKVQKKWWLALVGLLLAALFHGIFDTLTALPALVGLALMVALVYLIYFLVVKKEIAKAQAESHYAPVAAAILDAQK